MKKLHVINVGHGDAFILEPCPSCCYSDKNIIVDVGNQSRNIFNYCNPSKNLILSLSHSHDDHIGGLSFFPGIMNSIEEIWVPYYYDEVAKIATLLLNLNGVKNLNSNTSSITKLNNIISTHNLLLEIKKNININIKGLYKGKKLCSHIECLNPPIIASSCLNIDKDNLSEFIKKISNKTKNINNWFIRNKSGTNQDLFNIELEYAKIVDNNEDYYNEKYNYVLGFLYKYETDINKFLNAPNSRNFDRLYSKLKLESNDASIVKRYYDEKDSILFTGDVGKQFFKRCIIDNIDISANILKLPHHGSKNNMNTEILKYINPEVVIITHNNRRFGRSIDTLPNNYIINILQKSGVSTLYTNDVIKNGVCIEKKPNNLIFQSNIYYYK